ncbi:MAG: sugar ABC transporter ATP-binding protein [Actinobacteria bacterium]|nr:sugar ABC transporter ATP-binding protein [Actinomycetota bacterium]MBS1881906.1 sugar ABC transporter ATP-binding protein [Actinomycetota bacterium]
MIALRADGVSKAFDGTQALDDVSFELEQGAVHALLGGNGCGKSTLIKILAGVLPADAGSIEIGGERHELRWMTSTRARAAGLHFVHQRRSTFPELSVMDNLSIGRGFDTSLGRIRWSAARRRAADVLERFQIDAHPDQDLWELSPATQVMVAIARALQDQDDSSEGVLVLDEPTASLPAPEVELLLTTLRRYATAGQAIVYVTHRLEEVFAVADRATLLRDGRLVDTVSPKDLDHEGLVELMMGRTVEQIERLERAPEGKAVLEISGLRAGPLRGIDLTARSGEVVGIAGLIGSGRSTLLKALFGVVPLEAGEVSIDGSSWTVSDPRGAMAAGIAYVPEDRQKDAAFEELSVCENLSLTVIPQYWHHAVLGRRQERRDALELFDSFLIKAESEEAPFSSLSGGNQQKVVVARWLRRDPRVLLLDEPTQGVDVGARAEIYELIVRAVSDGATALVVSSDFEELARICDRVVVLGRGMTVGELQNHELGAEAIAHLANTELRS